MHNRRRVWLLGLLVLTCAVWPGLVVSQTDLVNANLVVAGHVNACTVGPSGGSSNYVCTLDRTITALAVKACYSFLADVANTGPATVNYSNLGAKTIKKMVGGIATDLLANDIRAGQIVQTCWDGTNMQMMSQLGRLGVGRGLVFELSNTSGLTAASTTTAYVTVPFACTLSAYNLVIDQGTITVKFWKRATGTQIPTSANSISTNGVNISTGTAVHSTTLTDFTTTAVVANDMLAMNVTAVTSATYVSATLQCDQ